MAGPGHWTFIPLNNQNVFKIIAKFVLKSFWVFDFPFRTKVRQQTMTNTKI